MRYFLEESEVTLEELNRIKEEIFKEGFFIVLSDATPNYMDFSIKEI